MLAHDTKDTLLSKLPDLPPLAAQILGTLSGYSSQLPDLAALAKSESKTSLGVLVESARLFPKQPPKEFESAAQAIGPRGLRRGTLRGVLPSLFDDKEPDGGIDQEMLWWQAHIRAGAAERIAELAESSHLAAAYPAAFLADVGRLGLEACGVDGADEGLYLLRATGLRALETEQRLYGTDHALAGKWMLEYWGLPEDVATAVWLQYHPTRSLDGSGYPVQLIDIVAAARQLTAAQMTGRIEEFLEDTEALRERIGLSEEVWRECAYTDYDQHIPELEPMEELPAEPGADAELDIETLQRKARLYEAIAGLYRDCLSQPNDRAVLAHIERRLRACFPISAGLCFLSDEHGAIRAGRLWRAIDESAEPLDIARDRHERDPADAVQQLLKNIGPVDASEARFHQGLLAAPIAKDGKVYGQIIADAGDSEDQLDLKALADFARACAAVAAETRRRDHDAAHHEELATALWKQESQHQAAMRKVRLESIGRMAAGAAHEINNPLAIISGRAQLLLARSNDPEQTGSLETIVHQSRRASKIITDLMQFARPETPKLRPLHISQVVHQTCSMLSERMREYGIRLVEDYADAAPLVDGDRHQLEQVFTHLVSNALHAMKLGGGTLTVRVKTGKDQRSVVVQVSDSGSGIAPEHLEHVFEPFYTTKTEDEPGTGLGLAVCHSIVERNHGTINLHSALGEGCTCTLRFPASTHEEAELPEAAEQMPPAEGAEFVSTPTDPDPLVTAPKAERPRMVICEPNADACEVLTQTLASRGFEVIAFGDPLETLAEAMSREPAAVLCDLHQLALDDVPLIRQLRQRFTKLPIIAFTTAAITDLEVDPLVPLATEIVHKPFHLDALFTAVNRALGIQQREAL